MLEFEPKRRFTIEDLAANVFPGEVVGRAQLVSVRRALGALKVERCRSGKMGERGWRYVVAYSP